MSHFALVDDILSREEFDRRVQQKITQAGDLIDEQTAAMLVVRECGREHVKIRGIGTGASVITFFAKVVALGSPATFTRADGSSGTVARLTVGDESGQLTVILWDEKTALLDEIGCGDVLEIIGRPSRSRSGEVHLLAARGAGCDITVSGTAPADKGAGEPFAVRILSLGEVRAFTRRDGSPGEMQEGVVGDEQGTYRFVCWSPPLLSAFAPGDGILLTGAKRNMRTDGETEVHIDQNGTVAACDAAGDVTPTAVQAIREGRIPAVEGVIADLSRVRGFTSKRGDRSLVRDGVLRDDSGSVPIVLWGEHAQLPIADGDRIAVYGAQARKGRSAPLEIHAGRSSGIAIRRGAAQETTVEGTIIPTRQGPVLDSGDAWYFLDGDFPAGKEVRVRGTVEGHRLQIRTMEPVVIDPEDLRTRARRLIRGR
jgi:replication factor A1